ncbi:multidrug resistance-associated ABC transporter [Panaeolus papilionaceus]|nr:multidrug resistance-associated ABC transporter [Panaeolus papilionaceus]
MDLTSFLYQDGDDRGVNTSPSLPKDWWRNSLLLPIVFVAASALLLLTRFASQNRHRGASGRTDDGEDIGNGQPSETKGFLARHGGFVVFGFRATRFVASVALFGVQLYQFIHEVDVTEGGHVWGDIFRVDRYPQLTLVITYWYTSILTLLAIGTGPWASVTRKHAITILLILFTVYCYRDIGRWATYTLEPLDKDEGQLLYVKLVLLTVAAVTVPLFIPRVYVPVDPKNPMEVPNPEQTASIFSLAVYTFLDSIISEASRVPHLPFDRLPALADYDRAAYLKEKSFPYLDQFRARKKRHLFWSLMTVFSWEYTGMALCLTFMSVTRFVSPLALNRILDFMESGDTGDRIISPWFWVVSLFFGPVLGSIAWQWYIFLGTRCLARTQGILTQLIFEHSLRIRLKAETSNSDKTVTAPTTPDSASVTDAGSTTEAEESDDTQSESTAVAKGKAKAKDGEAAKAPTPAPAAKKDNLVGKINTLVTVDVDTILSAKDFLMFVVQVPLELGLSALFLYKIMGWSAFVGFASIIVLLPAPGYIASLIQNYHEEKMAKTDARVDAVTETVGVLRMVKLFGWEKKMTAYLKGKREDELTWVWKNKIIELVNGVVNSFIPTVTMVVTYATYTMIMKQSLTPSIVFSSMAIFDRVREKLHMSSWSFAQVMRGKVSLERIQKFLRDTDLLDEFDDKASETMAQAASRLDDSRKSVIGFKDAVFMWDVPSGTETPSSRTFRLQVGGELRFRRNCVNLIVGPTGAGKTSVLMALLGEMHYNPNSLDSWFNLPRAGGIAYAAQESWVQNETIKENILFGAAYDEERYKKVIYQCALTRDLELFEAGDQTEVGEKGLTLSGGQKARVTLARALYSSAEIILLDDILAALDVHTSRWIVKECLQGDLIRGRTVLLVTHNIALAGPVAGFFVAVDINGVAKEAGTTLSSVLATVPVLEKEFEAEKEALAEAEKEEASGSEETKDADNKTTGKLILAEEIQEGHVTMKSIMLYLKALGGSRPVLFAVFWVFTLLCSPAAETFSVWFLGFWSSQYEGRPPQEVRVVLYLSLYILSLVVMQAFFALSDIYYIMGAQRASRYINNTLIESILTSTLRWLDETPTSRIIARCTQDIGIVDNELERNFQSVLILFFILTVKMIAPVLFTPFFLVPSLVVALVGMYTGNQYLKAQLSVKREMSNARSPVLAHFGAAIAGLTSIRAYGAQDAFKNKSLTRIDHYTRIARTSYNLNRWAGVRLDLIGNAFTATMAAYLLVTRSISAANTGFSLVQSIEFCSMILYLVRSYNDLEVQSNSLERIQAYIDIDHEAQPTESGKPPAAWPMSGNLTVDKLSARYSANGPKVLQDISFHVGTVGRTGSGKSSLTLALLRCILVEGNVLYDGLPVNKINLDALRTSITIIPQIPELLSGTLRRNLDPFEQYDDAILNDALHASGLFSLQSEMDEGKLTLDSQIASGGGNLSVGQRQIIALARAIVRNSKLLILDEATSAIDHKTDSIIQSTLRTRLGSDVSVLTVAHRLQTIMDSDKIMVLDAGKIVEYDAPSKLLRKEGGAFKSMVDGSGDKQALYAACAEK